MYPFVWFLLIFLNIFTAAINYEAGKEIEPILNLSIALLCVVMLTLGLINSGNNYDNDRRRTKNDDKKDHL